MNQAEKTGLIITGGTIDDVFAHCFLKKHTYDLVIAVDGGLAAVKRLDLHPDAIVGDFDTAAAELLEEYRCQKNILWEQHRPEKDATDTELAIHTARSLDCTRLYILGATGGRMDHAIGNLHLLYSCLLEGTEAYMADEKNMISVISKGRSFDRKKLYGTYISFLPLTEQVHGITLTGFKYPLWDKDITIGTSLCISNELSEETGTITFQDGVLICIESHD